MKLKNIIDTIKENLVNNETCDECNQLLTECDCSQTETETNSSAEYEEN